MVDMLEGLGFEAEQADCVSTALDFLQRRGERTSLLLTDVSMPGSRNGVTLANHVSYVWPNIRILVTSGVSHPNSGELPAEAQFITKPVTPISLAACVTDLSSRSLPGISS